MRIIRFIPINCNPYADETWLQVRVRAKSFSNKIVDIQFTFICDNDLSEKEAIDIFYTSKKDIIKQSILNEINIDELFISDFGKITKG